MWDDVTLCMAGEAAERLFGVSPDDTRLHVMHDWYEASMLLIPAWRAGLWSLTSSSLRRRRSCPRPAAGPSDFSEHTSTISSSWRTMPSGWLRTENLQFGRRPANKNEGERLKEVFEKSAPLLGEMPR